MLKIVPELNKDEEIVAITIELTPKDFKEFYQLMGALKKINHGPRKNGLVREMFNGVAEALGWQKFI